MRFPRLWIVAPVLSLVASGASANEELIKLSKDSNQWVMQNGNYASQRYSELNQINKDNAKNLRPMWTFSTGVLRGHEGGPLVIGDVMYVHTAFPNNVFALNLFLAALAIGTTLLQSRFSIFASWLAAGLAVSLVMYRFSRPRSSS